MLNVSSAVKAKFQSDLCRKELKITIGSTVLTNAAIYKDGFKLTEAVMDGTVEFVGCIASILEFKVSTTALAKGNYKGQAVVAEVAVYLDENTLSSYIPLFHGYVDECTKSADGYYQQFVCYDRLAYLSDEPGYNMYKAAFNGSSIDLETFRDAIVLDCGMDAVNNQTLPNDDIIFKKRKRNKDVTAMALLRHIAQINGCFGILNRDNRFEFRQIDDAASPESIAYYRDMTYSDYVVKPVGDSTTNPPTGSITIRTNSQDAGVTVDWTNYTTYAGTDPGWSDESQDTYLVDDNDADVVVDSYIIESNLIAYKLKKSKKQVIGANILASLGHDAVFREHSVKCNGLPYVECCDKVLFTKGDNTQIEFVVTKRVLEGVQNMTDTYSCTITAQDANNKTFVSNVDNSTNSLGGNPDEALGLTEKTITVNGTYSALDDNAEGYSQVTVNVESPTPPTPIGSDMYYYPWEKCNDLPFDFIRGCCIVYDGEIHCIAPVQQTASSGHGNTLLHYIYDEANDSWTQAASCPSQTVFPQPGHTGPSYNFGDYGMGINCYILGSDLKLSVPIGTPFPWKWTGSYWEADNGPDEPGQWYQSYLNYASPWVEYNGKLYVFNADSTQHYNDIGWFDETNHRYVSTQHDTPWPMHNGIVIKCGNDYHFIGGGPGPKPQIEYDEWGEEEIQHIAYYDGVTPTWVMHAKTSDMVNFTRLADVPVNVYYPPHSKGAYHTGQPSETQPQGIVLKNEKNEDEIHLISSGYHLIYNPIYDKWRFADSLVDDQEYIDSSHEGLIDSTYRRVNTPYSDNAGIVVLGDYIHVIGGHNTTRKHYKCKRTKYNTF